MMPYERLKAWKVSHELALEIYRRAALSIPTNLAEGSAKLGPREFRRYLDICLGSLSELSYLLLFSRDRGLVSAECWKALDQQRNRAGQLVWRLYRAVQRTAQS